MLDLKKIKNNDYSDVFVYSEQTIDRKDYEILTSEHLPNNLKDIKFSLADFQIYVLPDGSLVRYDTVSKVFTVIKGVSFISVSEVLSNGAGITIDASQNTFGFWLTFLMQHRYKKNMDYDHIYNFIKESKLSREQEEYAEIYKEHIKSFYLLCDKITTKEKILEYLSSLETLPYRDIKQLKFLKLIGNIYKALSFEDLYPLNTFFDTSYLPIASFDALKATTGGRIEGKDIMDRINSIISYLIDNKYGLIHKTEWTEDDVISMINALAEAYSSISGNKDITSYDLQLKINKLVDYVGPFVFILFSLNWFENYNKVGDKVSWNFKQLKHGMRDELFRRIDNLGIIPKPENLGDILPLLISYDKINIKGLEISIDNIFSGKLKLLEELFIALKSEFGTDKITQSFLLRETYSNIRSEIKSWIFNQKEYSHIDKFYLYNQFRSTLASRLTRKEPNEDGDPVGDNFNGFFTILMNIQKKLPQIQSHYWADTESVPVITFTDQSGNEKTIEFTAKFLYDTVNILRNPTTIGGFDNFIRIKGSFMRNDLLVGEALSFTKYDGFYSEMTTYLQSIANKLNKEALYFDFVFLQKDGTFHIYGERTPLYFIKSGYLKLDFKNLGSSEYRQNLLRMYEALLHGVHIRLLGNKVDGGISSANRGNILCIVSMDGLSSLHRTDPTICTVFPASINNDIEQLDNLIRNFVIQNSVPTYLLRSYDMLFLDRQTFVSTLLKAGDDARLRYFKQNIDKGYIKVFNEMVLKNPPDGFDINTWKEWYKIYIKKGDPIDKDAIRIFLSLMIKNWDDKWYFSSIGEFDFDAIEIELQPWFSSEFLILRKYFPNIQNVD